MDAIARKAQKLLSTRREALFQRFREDEEEDETLRASAPPDPLDRAASGEQDARLVKLTDLERHELEDIDAALARIAAGSYGRCLACGNAIGRQRLAAIPEARTCAQCSGAERRA